MRWVYFLVAVLAALLAQTTIGLVLWFRTSLGWIGPELLATVAVFVALNVRSSTSAALAGWALGFAAVGLAGFAALVLLRPHADPGDHGIRLRRGGVRSVGDLRPGGR